MKSAYDVPVTIHMEHVIHAQPSTNQTQTTLFFEGEPPMTIQVKWADWITLLGIPT